MHMRMPVETTAIRMDGAEDTGFIKQKIESFNFNEALKQQILKDISLCSYEGLHVLKIEIKSVGEVCHFENRYYIRQGTATHLITDGEAISSLHRLYYS